MKGLTLSAKEESRLRILDGVLERYRAMKEAVPLLGRPKLELLRFCLPRAGKGKRRRRRIGP